MPVSSGLNAHFEWQWIEDFLEGDDSAFSSFYQRYRGPLFRVLEALLPENRVQRLYIQTWLDWLQGLRELSPDVQPGAALFAHAHRLMLDHYRLHDKAIILSFADGVIETVGEVPESDGDVAASASQTHLEALPLAWREALQVYLETGFDGEHLGYALHVSRETARSRLKRAFALWRKQWPSNLEEDDEQASKNLQVWIQRYRALAHAEPPDFVDARIQRAADWHNHWLPRLWQQLVRHRYLWVTTVLTTLGVFGYLWTRTIPPSYQLEIEAPHLPVVAASAPVALVREFVPPARQEQALLPFARPEPPASVASAAPATSAPKAVVKPKKVPATSAAAAQPVAASSATASPEKKHEAETKPAMAPGDKKTEPVVSEPAPASETTVPAETPPQ